MRLRNIKNSKEIINKSNHYISNPEEHIGLWDKVFKNDNKIQVEIGMGMGNFIISLALQNPNINYVGIEMFDKVLVRTIFNINKREEEIENLKVIRYDAFNIDKIFYKEIDAIFLNFSDPWPKDRHEKRRLTSGLFIDKYELTFKNIKRIIQKTDNVDLFNYSIESFKNNKYIFKDITYDLHKIKNNTNVLTEYEEKFKNQGIKICKLEVYKE